MGPIMQLTDGFGAALVLAVAVVVGIALNLQRSACEHERISISGMAIGDRCK